MKETIRKGIIQFPRGEDGNPVFDFETPRAIQIIPKDSESGIHEFNSYMPVTGLYSGSWESEYLWDFETDRKGNYILDTAGNRIVKKVAIASKPGEFAPKRLTLKCPIGGAIELKVPEDNGVIKQLLRVPNNGSVEAIDGKFTNRFTPIFYMIDSLTTRKLQSEERRKERDAIGFAKNIPAHKLNGFRAYLGLSVEKQLSENGSLVYMEDDMRYELDSYARNHAQKFLENVKFNDQLSEDVLMALAEEASIIQNLGGSGYYYIRKDAKNLNLGLTREDAIDYMRKHEHVFRDVSLRSGHHLFASDFASETKEGVVDLASEQAAEIKKLKEELERLRAEEKASRPVHRYAKKVEAE